MVFVLCGSRVPKIRKQVVGSIAGQEVMDAFTNATGVELDSHVETVAGGALGGAGTIALGMIYFGMGFPGSKTVIDWTKKRIEQPYETTQYAFLGVGSAILISRAYK